ncbi:hypothetical protein N5P37_002332 [Trichoderma harzianum]|nr:hypothetical protein N5P37_002332 [Trichoderma harzianum]
MKCSVCGYGYGHIMLAFGVVVVSCDGGTQGVISNHADWEKRGGRRILCDNSVFQSATSGGCAALGGCGCDTEPPCCIQTALDLDFLAKRSTGTGSSTSTRLNVPARVELQGGCKS